MVRITGGGRTDRTHIPIELSRCLNAGAMGRQDYETETLIPVIGGCFSETAHALRADGFDASEDGTGRGTPIIPILEVGKGSTSRGAGPNGCGIGEAGDPMFTLLSGAHADSKPHCVDSQMRVRRLLPEECERLMGLPDNWTAIEYRGKPAEDGPRYRAIGNGMVVNEMRWIGERMMMLDQLKGRAP